MAVSEPRKPTVLHWLARTTWARVCLYPMVDYGAHVKTHIRIRRVSDNALVINHEESGTPPGNSFTISSLSLVAGVEYALRAAFETTEYGKDSYCANVYARVPYTTFSATAIAVQGEPTATETLPILPDRAQGITYRRATRSWETQTGHLMRRPEHSSGRRAARMTWAHLTAEDRDTLRTFLEERAEAAEGFLTEGEVLGDVILGEEAAWLARAGRLGVTDNGDGTYTLELEADEVKL